MTLRKILFSALAVLMLAGLSTAQITINADDTPDYGDIYSSLSTIDLVTVNAGPSGANQTWTIPEYDWYEEPAVTVFINPAQTPHHDLFPTANMATSNEDWETNPLSAMIYSRIVSSGYWLLGMVIDTMDLVYDAESLVMPFPVTYGSSWTSVTRWEIVAGPVSIVYVDSVLNNVDGWGTLNTELGSWSALRNFEHHWSTIIYPPPLPPMTDEWVGYTWLTNDAMAGASYESESGDTNPNFTQGYAGIGRMGPLAAKPERGPIVEKFSLSQNYPNPFNPSTVLPLSLEKAGTVTVSIYDATGRLVSSEVHELTAGPHELPVDGSSWATGTYFARVSAGGQQQTVPMKLIK